MLEDPASLLARLRAADEAGERTALVRRWGDAVAAGTLSGEALGDVAVLLLETLTDADGSLDMTAAGLLREYGAARHIDPVRALRPRLRPRVALRDWRLEVDRALAVVTARRDGACECTVDARHGGGIYREHYEVVDEADDVEAYVTVSSVRCTRCGRRWRVRAEHGYHYPMFRWSPAPST